MKAPNTISMQKGQKGRRKDVRKKNELQKLGDKKQSKKQSKLKKNVFEKNRRQKMMLKGGKWKQKKAN